jgi:hypothetical protein
MSAPKDVTTVTLTVGKLEAARRQLETAFTLWFSGGDPISIHTLTCAAYEIIHAVSKKRNPGRRDLLFDSLVVPDEYRGDVNRLMKEPANFFEHAKNDADAVIEFKPALTELFMMYSMLGIHACGERPNAAESAFFTWIFIHKPHLLTDHGRKFFADSIPVNEIQKLRSLRKEELFQRVKLAWARAQQLPISD